MIFFALLGWPKGVFRTLGFLGFRSNEGGGEVSSAKKRAKKAFSGRPRSICFSEKPGKANSFSGQNNFFSLIRPLGAKSALWRAKRRGPKEAFSLKGVRFGGPKKKAFDQGLKSGPGDDAFWAQRTLWILAAKRTLFSGAK
jgi:hypothetical protein